MFRYKFRFPREGKEKLSWANKRQGSPLGLIYFATCDEVPSFPIKIGFTTNLMRRKSELQTALPWKIEILGHRQGRELDEQEIHKQFKELRMEGEWFRRDVKLESYIRETCKVQFP